MQTEGETISVQIAAALPWGYQAWSHRATIRFDGWFELWRFRRLFPHLSFKAAVSNIPVIDLTNVEDDMEEVALEEEMDACQPDDAVSVISSLSSETIADNDQYL